MIIRILSKVTITGAVMCGLCDLAYQAGKGRTLATLSYYDATADNTIKMLSESKKHYPNKVILFVCETTKKVFAKREEES